MRKKGFTLIELLAVIVILAIIALIATPIILNIINGAKKSAEKRSVELYGKAVENAVGIYQINHPDEKVIGTFKQTNKGATITSNEDSNIVLDVDYTGQSVECKNIQVNSNGTVCVSGCVISNHDVDYSYGDSCGNSSSSNSGVVYRFGEDRLSIGDSLNNTVETTTNPSTLNKNVYLKHEIENNIITASYACLRYEYPSGTTKEACFRGVDSSYYGTYDGTSSNVIYDLSNLNPTGNIAVIESTRSYFEANKGSCDFKSSASHCRIGSSSTEIEAMPNGQVGARVGNYQCYVSLNGSAACY